jgi:hypothetical protein
VWQFARKKKKSEMWNQRRRRSVAAGYFSLIKWSYVNKTILGLCFVIVGLGHQACFWTNVIFLA